jgi:uncharacterized NAD-dependent epimerase/dehydratase family protein
MDRLPLAVIDTGVDPAHPALPAVAGGASFSLDGTGNVRTGDDWRDRAGHGTACAGVASAGLASRIDLLALRVVDDQGASTVRLVEAALAFAVACGARVVNVSLGAPVWQAEALARMRAVVAEATRRGVIIVAAAGPEGTRALPAVLDEVISVGSAVCPPDTLYATDEGGVDFLAKGDLQRIPWIEGRSVLGEGTSLAAAHVTNAVCRLLLTQPGLDPAGVRASLALRAIGADGADGADHRLRLDAFSAARGPGRAGWLRRAAVYPFNKETHALVRFRHLLPFALAAVGDPPGKRLTGRDAGEVLGEAPAGLPIFPSFERALAEGDGVVLGHLEAMTPAGSRGLLRDLVHRAVRAGKGVYSFSRLDVPELAEVRALAEARGVPLVDPTVSRAEAAAVLRARPGDGASPLRDPRFRRHGAAIRRTLGRPLLHDCPVLGVFGTSGAQGKFSLQLALVAALRQMGYHVSHLCTEPSGMLFGASATFPTGYERGNDLSIDETTALVGTLVTEIKNRERPDLLLVGGQSSTVTVTPALYRWGAASLSTLAFGAATQPDACVLVANPFDPPEQVERCRDALASVLHTRVLAAAFGDQAFEDHTWKGVTRRRRVRLPADALRERLGAWQRRLGIPCCAVLAPEDQARLAELVVDHFAAAGEAVAA